MRTKCKGGVWLRSEPDYHQRLYFSPPCGLKSCATCAKKKRYAHIARIMLMTQKHPELNWYFITMTNRDHIHKEGDTEKSLAVLRHAWSLYRKRMNRHTGLVYWVKVFEMHKTGIYHLHVIVGADKPLTYDWLHEHIFQSGMGYMFDRKKLTEHSIRYVAKYSTKTNIAIRAIEWSRNFPKLDESIPEETEEWEYLGNIDIITALQWDDATGREWKLLTDYEEKDD